MFDCSPAERSSRTAVVPTGAKVVDGLQLETVGARLQVDVDGAVLVTVDGEKI